jgi:hypothetical protein
MHTRHPGRYTGLFTNVRAHPDGEWWTA